MLHKLVPTKGQISLQFHCDVHVSLDGFITKAAKLVLLIAFNFSAVLSFVDVILISSVSESKTSFE